MGKARGEAASPPLNWSPGPAETLSYAIVFARTTNPVKYLWVLWDVPLSTLSLPAALPVMSLLTMPSGAKQEGLMSKMGYYGPCPNSSQADPYEFDLYSLDVATLPGVQVNSDLALIVNAITTHAIASAPPLRCTSNAHAK